jgi:secreted protein with Ig-like and vWFA domain
MNDDKDKPLNTVGDDALEARITAWVLGEASSFEAGELEKLCAADPALGLFERRLRVLHGLVAEDFKAGPMAEWRLAAERRAKITDLLGVEPEVVEKIAARRRKSRGPGVRGIILALAACVVLGFISISLIRGGGKSAKFETYSMMAESQVKASASERAAARDEALAQLARAVVTQKDVVEDKRKLLSQVIRQEGIIYNGDKTDGRGLDASDEAEVAAREYIRLDREKIQLESQIETLLKYDGPQLLVHAAGLSLPGNTIPQKVPQLHEAKREYDRLLSSGLGQNHPDLVAKGQKLKAMEAEVGQEVAELRDTLKAKLELTKEQASRLKNQRETTNEDAIDKGIANETFVDAKNDYESSLRLLETLQIKEIAERMQSKITEDAVVLNDMHPAMGLSNAERSSGAPAKKPDSAYSHLATNSAFTSKPPPASISVAPPSEPASGPVPEAQALAKNEPMPAQKAKESDEKLSDHAVGYVGGGAVGGRGAEAAPEVASRTSRDFIPMVEGVTVPGVPAATGATVTYALTAGNRSGDAAITRNNIDAIPTPSAGPAKIEGKDDGLKAWTGSFRNGAIATDEKALEELADEGRIAGAKGIAGTGESEFLTRNPEGDKLVDRFVAGKADEADLGGGGGGGGGMPQELQVGTFFNMNTTSESRFKANLRLGSERELGRDEAANFGDLESMGSLAEESSQQGADLNTYTGYRATTGDRQVVDGIANLSDLARKQRESRVDAGNPGQGFGLTAPAGGATATGGLKRDLSVDPFAEQAPAIPAPAATGDFDGFVNQGAPIQGETADESTKARFLFPTEAEPPSLLLTKDATDITAGVLKGLNQEAAAKIAPSGDEVRARIIEEVDKAWELSVPPVDGPVVTDPAGLVRSDSERKPGDADKDEAIRSNPALGVDGTAAVDEVRRKLYLAEGASNLGKYDQSQKAYEEVLRMDPYNKAARRGMEQLAAARADYYRAAYDQTRADVDGGVELIAPPIVQAGNELPSAEPDQVSELTALLEFEKALPEANSGTYSGLAHKEMLRRQNAVAQSDELRAAGRTAYAAGNYAEAYRKYVESLRLLPDAPTLEDRRAYIHQVLQDTAQALSVTAVRVGQNELADKWMEKSGEWAPKKAAVVEPTAETVTTDEPFSTFSLHVSDASFKLAQAAMERGEVPAAEGIRPEEFYNAFDYGDPAPANGEPVVCVTEQSAHPAFAQRNLLRIGVRTGSQGRGASTPLNLTLLLDHSGSMEREDRNAGLAMAVRQLSGLLKEGDTITVAGFSRQPRLLADRLPGARAQELNELIARTPSEGGTNLEEGLKLGEELAKRQFNPAAQNRVVLFTDGAANLGDARPEALQARIEGLRQQEIAFDAAGFGADGLNDKLLERLTRNGNGRYYIVDGPEDADAGFAKQLAGAFRPAAENVKVQVRFNPARVAKYKLIGFEEHRLQKEDFRNDAVDAAEMAAEEAGNALYQIETLPQGEGEVGEVSVRFRDVASGQMVERTWTIPYDAQAPAFDQATPSIQLAGLAAFTAEKLRAAPMAEAVDFQQLGQVYAGVRARYPNSQPVADLGSMIGKMK